MEIDVRAGPWKFIDLSVDEEREKFLMKTSFTENGYEILISNKVSLWHERLALEEIEKRMQKLNPGVEAPLSKILDHLRSNCEELDARRKDNKLTAVFQNIPNSDQQKLVMTMRTDLVGLPFVWKFVAHPADNNMVSVHLIIPLLTMSGELIRQQQELYKQLQNKDKEIEDLKAQGVKVTRKRLETRKFDEVEFKHDMKKSKGFEHQIQTEGELVFTEIGQQLYRELMIKRARLQNKDTEAESLDDGDDIVMDTTAGGSLLTCDSISPKKSPQKSPGSSDTSPTKDMEELRRQELENRLAKEIEKKIQKQKKKKLKL
ncbi:hypothetical protein LSH36_33g05000 [Paralvinella palmiformis]|uniref:Non-homologous end-joining factor 1 n=1 Tax=Paralvinella palmiformis TaxID=53620 RepID=A0AAD9NH42_9ANNE|nr:hypothetical protein LSH36_33g05000 [Paralvinella palmiformis]